MESMRYGRNEHSLVNQLYFNKKYGLKKAYLVSKTRIVYYASDKSCLSSFLFLGLYVVGMNIPPAESINKKCHSHWRFLASKWEWWWWFHH